MIVKKIYYSELLDMIRNGTNPDRVYYNHKCFRWYPYKKKYVHDTLKEEISLLEERVNNVLGNGIPLSNVEHLLIKFKVDCPVPLLDNTEKKYLSNIIRPYFTDNIIAVTKVSDRDNSEHLEIGIECSDSHYSFHTIKLPKFEKGTMYVGMEQGVAYSLPELGVV